MKVLGILGLALIVTGVSMIGDGGLVAIALGVLFLVLAYKKAVKKEEKEEKAKSKAKETKVPTAPVENRRTDISAVCGGAGEVLIEEIGSEKVEAIKAIRRFSEAAYSLKEAKQVTEEVPRSIRVTDVRAFCEIMQGIGCKVSASPDNEEAVADSGIPGAAQLMTGQLVAIFKKTHDERYRDLYIRRLMYIGFTKPQAVNLHMVELMTLKYDSVDVLCDPEYLHKNYFNLKNVIFPESAEYYAEHQMFLVSELTKIWDEAEYVYKMVKKDLPMEVRNEVYKISRYGGGDLFLKGLDKVSESSHTPMGLIQAYVQAEQGLLFKYKWYPNADEKHPYGEM